MPSFNMTQPQLNILTTWLFEPNGYLDFAVNDAGVTARQALAADPGLDVTQWVRDNTMMPGGDLISWNEVAMIWWIRANDQVNIPTPQRPPESAEWATILHEWDESINAGFARVPQNERDSNSITLFDEQQQPAGTMPAGSHLAQQQQIINKVLGVIE